MRRAVKDTLLAFTLPALLAGLLALGSSRAWGAPGPRSHPVILEPEWLERLNLFLIDPVRQRDELIAVARKGTDDLPPEALVPIGDAYLRSGDLRTAEAFFQRALAGQVIQPWEGAALLGLGVTNVARGDVDGGVLWLQRAAAEGGAIGDGALLALGQIETARGNYESAVDLYHEVLLHGDASPEMAQAAHVGTATAYFRAGDFERAAQEYRAAADRDPESQLAQDARYGAARAQLEVQIVDNGPGLHADVADRLFTSDFRGMKAYLCGPPGMVDACITTLMRGRLFENDIYQELFMSAADTQRVRSPLFKRI